jgi:two-component system sensor histidine kinase UhpB
MPPVHALAWLFWLAWMCSSGAAQAQALVFREAATLEVSAATASDWSRARNVTLPDDWASSRPKFSGLAAYRLGFDADAAASGGALYAMYIERACSALEVRINGQLIHRGGQLSEPVSRNCQQPQLVALPSALLQPKANLIELTVRGYALDEVGPRGGGWVGRGGTRSA